MRVSPRKAYMSTLGEMYDINSRITYDDWGSKRINDTSRGPLPCDPFAFTWLENHWHDSSLFYRPIDKRVYKVHSDKIYKRLITS